MENILLYVMILIIVILITLIIWVFIISKKLKKLSAGKNSKSLESVIIENNNLTKNIKERQIMMENSIKNLELAIAKTIQNISVVRFDAVKNSGGLQSFAVGLTDNNKNGVVISSMYTRDHINVFAKEIINGRSKYTLTEEEKMTINN